MSKAYKNLIGMIALSLLFCTTCFAINDDDDSDQEQFSYSNLCVAQLPANGFDHYFCKECACVQREMESAKTLINIDPELFPPRHFLNLACTSHPGNQYHIQAKRQLISHLQQK